MPEVDAIHSICVCGAGTMGSGIAQVAAQAGFRTIQYDVNSSVLDRSRETIQKGLHLLSTKGKITADEQEAILSRLSFTGSMSDCRAELVIEAIVEDLDAKSRLLQQLAAVNSEATIFATNTSSISVSLIGETAGIAGRLGGMHFFNPAPVMKLVEIVRGAGTSEDTITRLQSIAKRMGKVPVICTDAPGFIVNRVARQYYLEALKLVEAGGTDVATIDAVMEASGFRMGPFRLMDLIGIDVNYTVSNIVWEALGKPERLRPSTLQKEKVLNGKLGRKSGSGFYEY